MSVKQHVLDNVWLLPRVHISSAEYPDLSPVSTESMIYLPQDPAGGDEIDGAVEN